MRANGWEFFLLASRVVGFRGEEQGVVDKVQRTELGRRVFPVVVRVEKDGQSVDPASGPGSVKVALHGRSYGPNEALHTRCLDLGRCSVVANVVLS